MLKKFLTTTAISPLLPPSAMTPAERTAGRFMRAPDGHDAGDAGAAGNGDEGTAGAAAATTEGGEGTSDAGATPEGEGETVLGGAGEASGDAAKGEEKGEGEGEAGADACASGVPEKYELTPPDGFDAIDTEVLAEAEPILRELNLSNDQANKLMPFAGALVKKTMDRAEKAITERAVATRKEWSDAFDADAEIGGANKQRTIQEAAKAFDHYGLKKGEGLRQFLDETGLGNHPDLIRFVARVGRDLAEGSFERGEAAKTPKTGEQSLYGPEFQAKG